ILPYYRHSFFRKLHARLKAYDVNLTLYYGQENTGSVPKTRPLEEPWAIQITNSYVKLGTSEITWQPCYKQLKGYDLVIVEQAGRLLLNYALLINRYLGLTKLAYFGHGKNYQASNAIMHAVNWLKKCLLHKADWWFAYTSKSKALLTASGYPENKITLVENSIDTEELERSLEQVTAMDQFRVREQLNLTGEAQVSVFCGGMYSEKRLEFIVEASIEIQKQLPNYHLILIGEGPDENIATEAAKKYPWIHYAGPKYGKERAAFFKVSDLIMMPGLVGLVIIDSFVAKTPLITTNVAYHSPEIAYLENGINGIMTENSIQAYSKAIIRYFSEEKYRSVLKDGCKKASQHLTISNMVENFSEGIIAYLSESKQQTYAEPRTGNGS
ncbi:MAG: glycosyltransferase family 4 protein, partial [Gammaproteobacteria bacterium]|nr:glycosyltransferase family 4 protein [Gammaproteobacteria bacterium]